MADGFDGPFDVDATKFPVDATSETEVPVEGGIDWAAVEAAGGRRPSLPGQTASEVIRAGNVTGLSATEVAAAEAADYLLNQPLGYGPGVVRDFNNPASPSLAPPVSEEAKMARKAERDLIVKILGQKYALVKQDIDGNPQWSAADASKHTLRGQVYWELINEFRGTPVNTQPKR